MRWTSLRGLLALSVAGVTALGGCNCGEPPEDCMGVAINFVAPSPTEQLTYEQDLDGDGSNGIQADVSVAVKDMCGNAAVMTSAKLERRGADEETWQDEKQGELEEGKATFRSVTFRPGVILRVRVVQQGRDTEYPKSQQYSNVFDPTARPVVTEFTFQQDANKDRVLNASELTNGAAPVAVIKTSNAVGEVTIWDASENAEFGSGTVVDGVATIELAGLPDKSNRSYSLVAVVRNSSGLENKRKDPTSVDPVNDAAFASLTIDLVAPTVTILTRSKVVFGPSE